MECAIVAKTNRTIHREIFIHTRPASSVRTISNRMTRCAYAAARFAFATG
jgi:hypothetical protein